MNRKISLGIAISLAAIACAVTFVITMTVSLGNYNGKIADVQQRGEIYTKLQEMDAFVKNYSIYSVDDAKMKNGVYTGYLKGMGDTRARYYSTDEYYYKKQVESGRLIGLGMEYAREEGGYIRVTDVYKGSPAESGGIQSGDIIISVNGVSVLELGYDAAFEQLRYGDEGTKQRVTLRRSGEETEHELVRSAFDIPSVDCLMLDNGILYIRFRSINESTGEKLAEAMGALPGEGITGYVFDLRGCSSGVYKSMSGILGQFLPQVQAASAVYRNNSTRVIAESSGEGFTNLPISIIIDERTGGSAELLAEALRDHAGGKTVGETSMGYATLQETKLFSDGTAVEISVAMIVPSAENSSYNEVGITPEFFVEYSGEYEIDPFGYATTQDVQLKKAVEVIASRVAMVSVEMESAETAQQE